MINKNPDAVIKMTVGEAKKLLEVLLAYVYPALNMYVDGYADILYKLEKGILATGAILDERKYIHQTKDDFEPTKPFLGHPSKKYFKAEEDYE